MLRLHSRWNVFATKIYLHVVPHLNEIFFILHPLRLDLAHQIGPRLRLQIAK
jgi:hypothetical protein